MIIKARRNMAFYGCDPFDDVYINPDHVMAVEIYKGNNEGKTIIRLPGDISYISECSFAEIILKLKEVKEV